MVDIDSFVVYFWQQLKEQDAVCLSHIPEGQFLVYSRSKPLVRVNQGNTTQALVWLSYTGEAFFVTIALD